MQSINVGSGVISPSGKARLLEMISARMSAELGMVIIPPILTWYYANSHDPTRLAIWSAVVFFMAVFLHWRRRQMARDRLLLSDELWVAKWWNLARDVPVGYGLVWAAPVLLIGRAAPFDFSLLLYASLAAIAAACATALAPVIGFFLRFFVCGWLVAVAAIYWVFPHHWQFLLPLLLLYSGIIFRHAQTTHQFLVKQVQLEEQSAYLAEQYRVTKEQAEAALSDKTEFLRTASHDLRQPVHAMGLLLDSVVRQSAEPHIKPLLVDLQSCVRSINLMFNALLDLTKIEIQSTRVDAASTLSLNDLFDELSVLFQGDARQRGLTWRCHLPSQHAQVHTQPALIRQALFNLTQNALRYTETGGVLAGVRRRGEDWLIEVWDTGVGIHQTDQQRVFSAYFRDDHAKQLDNVGLGLGLAVFVRCAKLMGATYGLRSRPGRGSCFWFRLPAAPVDVATDAMSRKPLGLASPLANSLANPLANALALDGRCLILDDDPLVRRALAGVLQAWNVDARLVATPQQAMDCIERGFEPQVIFCDQRLRSADSGYDVLRALMARCPQARGGMMSGEFNSPQLLQAEEDGFVVLRKPVEAATLHAVLARWLVADTPSR